MRSRIFVFLLLVLTACQPKTLPDTPTPSDTPTHIATQAPTQPQPTVTAPATLPSTPTLIPYESPLPSANTFSLQYPEGTKAGLGLGYIDLGGTIALSLDYSRVIVETSMGILILDSVTLQEVWSIPFARGSSSWSHDGSKLQVANDEIVIVFDAETGEEINRLLYDDVFPNHPDGWQYGWGLGFWSPDDTLLSIGSVLWNYTENRIISRDSYGYFWLPDGHRTIGELEGSTVMYDAATGEPIQTYEGRWEGLSPDFSILTTWIDAGDAVDVYIWDLETGKQLWSYDNHWAQVSPDWTMLAVPNEDGSIDVFPFGREEPDIPLYTLDAGIPKEGIIGVWSDNSSMLVTSQGGKTTIWDAADGSIICTIETGEFYPTWFPDGERFITFGPEDHVMSIWDADTCTRTGTTPRYSRYYPTVAFLNEGEQLFFLDNDGDPDDGLMVWDMQTSRVISQLIGSAASQIGWTNDSAHVVTVLADKELGDRKVFWNLETATPVPAFNTDVIYPQYQQIMSDGTPILSPDEQVSFRWRDDINLEMYDPITGQTIRSLEAYKTYPHYNSWIEWSSDERFIIVKVQDSDGNPDYSHFYLFDTAIWQLQGDWYGFAFAVSPDNRWMAIERLGTVMVLPTP